MRKGLVMEGGAMRGMFTCGVLDVMMKNEIVPDGAIGVSAGAAFGCNIKSKQPGRALRYNMRFAKDWRYCSVRSWLLTGDLYGGHFCYDILPAELDVWDTETFRNNPMEFWVVATDAHTGEPRYHLCTDGGREDLLWIRASASMPVASKAVHVDNMDMLDGGISDSIPLCFFEQKGYDRNIVILTQPADYRKKQYSKIQLKMLKAALHQYPAVYQKLEERWSVYNRQVEDIREQEEKGNILVIRPEQSLNISSMCDDPMEKKRVYDEGIKEGEKMLVKMKAFYDERK